MLQLNLSYYFIMNFPKADSIMLDTVMFAMQISSFCTVTISAGPARVSMFTIHHFSSILLLSVYILSLK